jgi:hypothetical protein
MDKQLAEKGMDRPGGLSHWLRKLLILRYGTSGFAYH